MIYNFLVPVMSESEYANNRNYMLYVIIGIVAVLLLLLILVPIIAGRKKRNKDNSSEETETTKVNNHTFLKVVIKLLIIVVLVFAALINYRIFTFDGGFSKTNYENKDISNFLYEFTGIEKIEYYKRTIPHKDSPYAVFISTRGDNYLCGASEEDLKILKSTGALSGLLGSTKITPKEVTIIPFYVEIIAGFIVLIIPFGRRKRN